MKLYEILKGSEYSSDMFSQEVIAELENRLSSTYKCNFLGADNKQ